MSERFSARVTGKDSQEIEVTSYNGSVHMTTSGAGFYFSTWLGSEDALQLAINLLAATERKPTVSAA